MVDLWGPGAFGAAGAASVRPAFSPANGFGDPDTFYQDCTSSYADDGTEWRAAALNALIVQLRNTVRKSGVAPSNLDDFLLARALRAQALNYRAAAGTASALTVVLDPEPASWADLTNVPLDIRIAANNPGAATLSPSGLAARSILRRDGTALQRDDLVAGVVYRMRSDGTAIRLDVPASGETKTILRGDLTLYVRTDGNDANSGFVNNAGGALRTIQAAATLASQRYDTAGYTISIRVGSGTYNENVSLARSSTSNIEIIGDQISPASCVIAAASGDAITATIGSRLSISGFRLIAPAGYAMAAFDGSSIRFSAIDFGTALGAHIFSAQNSFISADGNYSISAAASAHAFAISSATIALSSWTVTFFGGAQNYSGRFIHANSAKIFVDGVTWTNAGIVTGTRYLSEIGGMIWTAGAGASFLPGTVAGSNPTGGNYY